MRAYGWQAVTLDRRVHAFLQLDDVLVAQDRVAVGQLAFQTLLVDALAQLVLQRLHGLAQLLRDGLAFQRLDVEAGGARRKYEKHHNGHVRV